MLHIHATVHRFHLTSFIGLSSDSRPCAVIPAAVDRFLANLEESRPTYTLCLRLQVEIEVMWT